MAAKHEDMDKLTKDLENLEVEKSETVTDILEHFRGILETYSKTQEDRNKIDPNKGIRNMFERSTKSQRIDIKLRDHTEDVRDHTKDAEERKKNLGDFFQYLIYKHLEEQGFQAEHSYRKYEFYDKRFGVAVMDMIQPVEAETKRLEVILPSNKSKAKLLPPNKFKARGRADFYTCGGEGPSILIDFKWTSDNYPIPSPGYALQLLLYQWLAGQRFEEVQGAKMYLIRFVEPTGELQLFQFNPPEKMQYSQANAGAYNYKDIVRLFLKKYYPELPEDSYK